MHSWGDSWEHWDTLYKAEHFLNVFYYKCTKKNMWIKEKWGTIRFEYESKWLENERDFKIFKESIRRTVKKYPEVAGEVCSSAGHVLDDPYFEGWCAGICFKANGSYWKSKDRPRGV